MSKNQSDTTILIVDDDSMMLQLAEAIIQRNTDYRTLLANSGIQCIDRIQQEHVDLILLDIQMPGMSGIKTMEVIRRREDWNSIPIIFLTAASDRETVLQAGMLKPASFVKKPFRPAELIERIHAALAEKALNDPTIVSLLEEFGSLGGTPPETK